MKRPKIESLQSLRFFLILGVIFSHLGMNCGYAFYSVSAFFVLSGFVLTYAYFDKVIDDALGFAIRKSGTLYVLHILALCILFPVFLCALRETGNEHGWITVVTDVLLLQSWFPHVTIRESINDVSWFLSTTVFLYLCFPMILKLFKGKNCSLRKRFLQMLLAFLVVILQFFFFWFLFEKMEALGDIRHTVYEWFTYRLPITRLVDFTCGCITALVYFEIQKMGIVWNTKKRVLLILGEVFTILLIPATKHLVVGKLLSGKLGGLENQTSIYIIPATLLVFVFSLNEGYISKILNNPATVWLGGISGYVFLIHYVIINYVNEYHSYIPETINLGLIRFAVIVVSFASAWVYSFLVKFVRAKLINKCR